MKANINGYDTGTILYCDIPGKEMLKNIQKEFPLISGIYFGNILILSKFDSNEKQLKDFANQWIN